jgi:DNA-binding beta-propeller fold protein YncE/cytochrome oxidase Cu insertion factor (SCO1/SenC/PrrC family)
MRKNSSTIRRIMAGFAVAASIGCVLGRGIMTGRQPTSPESGQRTNPYMKLVSYNQGAAPSLRGGVDWINSGPIALSELRGKIVLLDFWTFCCINCHHILPDLAKLEEKYKNELVVIGVHSGKFDAERDTTNIRRKVAEYRIKHPVVNDARMTIWNRFGVNSWPTIVLIDAQGEYQGSIAGEGHYESLDRTIGQLVEAARARGVLDVTPLKFTTEMERPSNGPLLYPGKVLADPAGKRLFIADTGHNRIIQTNLEGADPVTIGSGDEGFSDAGFDRASFNRPQGMCLDGETLYVADTENHAIRAVDLKEHTVTTIAGIGSQAHNIPHPGSSGPARTTPLCSPWDVIQLPGHKAIYIAMAGTHQIWKLDPGSETISVFAGSGIENITAGTAATANFAQPSGLATDGENLYVADSEASGLRAITGIGGRAPAVLTIVGQGLFEFGDRDGRAATVRLQHCLGLSYAGGHLYIADTYNNKVKICEPRNRSVHTFVGSHKPGDSDEPPHFYEPGGLSATEDRLYVADTNNNKIRTVDLKTHAVKTLALEGLTPPRLAPRPPSFPNKKVIDVAGTLAPPGNSIAIAIAIPLAKGQKLNEEVPLTYLVETPERTDILGPEVLPEGQKIKPPTTNFTITVPLAKPAATGDKIDLRLSLQTFVCSETSSLCTIKSYVWNIPVTFTDSANSARVKLSAETK